MKNRCAALAAIAMIGMGTAAMAQTSGGAMSAGAMSGDAMHSSAMMPTMVCRAAGKGENASAKMMDGDAIVCKKLDMSKMTPDQQKMLMQNLSIPLASGEQVPIQPHN
jgi:hypothetical protein